MKVLIFTLLLIPTALWAAEYECPRSVSIRVATTDDTGEWTGDVDGTREAPASFQGASMPGKLLRCSYATRKGITVSLNRSLPPDSICKVTSDISKRTGKFDCHRN